MKNQIFLIISLVFLVIGITGIFFSGDIIEKLNIKKKINIVRVCKIIGFAISTISLVIIYFFRR